MAIGDTTKDKAKPSDWTTKIPMVGLDAVIKAVEAIHDEALETATMPQVAKALGYSGATSSPFYRRAVAARLFGLLAQGQGASLTDAAKAYIRPDDVGTKAAVLVAAIRGIPEYVDLLNRYAGKKFNVELATNVLVRNCNLTPACASVCAKAFEASISFAGMLGPDGTVQPAQMIGSVTWQGTGGNGEAPVKHETDSRTPPEPTNAPGSQSQTIYLDKEKTRSVTFTGPLEITKAEYDRICSWLEYSMIITDKAEEPKP